MISGNIFSNWNKPCYIAHKHSRPEEDEYGNEINTYSEPIKYMMNIQPINTTYNTNYETTVYGSNVDKIYKAVVPYNFKDIIKEGDIAYLDGQTPENEVEGTYGTSGNFVVDNVRPQNVATVIYFRKLNK